MASDPYLKVRCGVCGRPWNDHPGDIYCTRYRPDVVAYSDDDKAIAVNMPGKYDPRNLQRNPGDTRVGSPSFRIPKAEPATQPVKAIDVNPGANGDNS